MWINGVCPDVHCNKSNWWYMEEFMFDHPEFEICVGPGEFHFLTRAFFQHYFHHPVCNTYSCILETGNIRLTYKVYLCTTVFIKWAYGLNTGSCLDNNAIRSCDSIRRFVDHVIGLDLSGCSSYQQKLKLYSTQAPSVRYNCFSPYFELNSSYKHDHVDGFARKA